MAQRSQTSRLLRTTVRDLREVPADGMASTLVRFERLSTRGAAAEVSERPILAEIEAEAESSHLLGWIFELVYRLSGVHGLVW